MIIDSASSLPTYADIIFALASLSREYEVTARDLSLTQPERIMAAKRMALYDKAAQLCARLSAVSWVLAKSGDRLLVPSSSRQSAQPYRADCIACNCEAGMHGVFCHHMAFAEAVEDVLNATMEKEDGEEA